MIETVAMEGTTFAAPPHRFEAGTPMIAEAVGLGAAVDYLTALGHGRRPRRTSASWSRTRCDELAGGPGAAHARPARRSRTAARPSRSRCEGIHPHDVAQLLDEQGIAVRAGHHCARPVCVRYGVPATTRASFGVYTTPPRSTRWSAGCARCRRCSRDRDRSGLDVPGDHPGPLQAPAAPRAAGGLRRRGAPRQPDLRRRGDPARAVRRRRDRRARLGRRGLLDQPGLDVGHERSGGRQAGRRGHGPGARSSSA